MDWDGSVLAQPRGVGWCSSSEQKGAGLSPAACAGLMFQPAREGKKPMTGYCDHAQ